MVAWQARLRERERIAQDMHNSLGHQLALIAVHTGALEVDRDLIERQREVVGILRNASDTFGVEVLNEQPTHEPTADVVSGGQGLTDLAERVRLVGGMCHAGPADGGGFRVAGMLPYGAAPVAEAVPLAGAADDFRRQTTKPLVGDGRPVVVGPADWTFTERELAMVVRGAGAEARAVRSRSAAGTRSRRSCCWWWRPASVSTS